VGHWQEAMLIIGQLYSWSNNTSTLQTYVLWGSRWCSRLQLSTAGGCIPKPSSAGLDGKTRQKQACWFQGQNSHLSSNF